MTLKDIAHLITQKNYFFEVVIEGRQFKRKSIEQITAEGAESVFEYFIKIAKDNRVPQLGIQLSSKNGTSYLKRGFFLVQVEPVENSVDKAIVSVERPQHHSTNTKSMDVEARILQVRYDMLQKSHEDLERRNKDLERKNDSLYNDNSQLIRENATAKDKLELEYKTKELDLKNEANSGLGGVMGTVKEMPPEAWEFLAGLIPNHPMAKRRAGKEEEEEEESENMHSDPEAQACIEVMVQNLLDQDGKIVMMMAMIVEKLVTKPKALKEIYLKLYPAKPTDKPAETTE